MFNQRVSFQFLRAASLCSVVALSSLSINRPAVALPNSQLLEQMVVNSLGEDESTDTALAGESWLAKALLIAERIELVDDKAIALAGIAQGYAEQGDLETANELLSQSLQLVEQPAETESTEPEYTYNRPNVLNKIADGYIAAGEEAKAANVLHQSLDAISEVRGSTRNEMSSTEAVSKVNITTPNYRSLLEAIERYGEFGEAALAQPGLEKAIQISNANRDEFERSYGLGRIAIAYSQLKDATIADAGISTVSELLLTPDEATPPRLQLINRNSALIDIAEARARYGDSTEAIALLAPVLDFNSFYNLSKIAAVYRLLDDTVMAQSALDELVLVLESLPEPENRSDVNNRLWAIHNTAIAYIEIGAPEVAHSFLASTLPNLLESDNPEILFFLSQLANTYEQTGDISTQQALLQRAFELFAPDDLPDPNQLSAWQALGFEHMAQSYAQLSETAAPEQLALLLQIATDNDWDYSYPMYLAILSQAADQRGDVALMQQLHTNALNLLAPDENGIPRNDSSMMLNTLIMLAKVYGQTSETAVAIEGLQSLTQVADSLAMSSGSTEFRQQELLSAISIAYASL